MRRRNHTLQLVRASKRALQIGALLYPERGYWRPTTRGECETGPRPCPFVGCRYNLYLDVKPSGSILLNFPGLHPWQMNPDLSCALDTAALGGAKLEEVGARLNVTRERIRQIIVRAVDRLPSLTRDAMVYEAPRYHDDAVHEYLGW